MDLRGLNGAHVRCREIGETDIDAVADLLTAGFSRRGRAYWRRGLERQKLRESPEGYPRFGYMLESDGKPVGALLTIYSRRQRPEAKAGENGDYIQCNLSSWYVAQAYRNWAALLSSAAQKNRDVTFVNATPAPQTWPIIEAQGFRRYCAGLFVSLPALTLKSAGRIECVTARTQSIDGLSADDCERLRRHAEYGCVSLVCRTPDGPLPFIFRSWRIRSGRLPVPATQLIWSRSLEDYKRCSGSIGRALLWRGIAFVLLNANGPVEGLTGHYTERRGQKFTRGPNPPSITDLCDNEFSLYGP
jgi:hypothetical protein